MKVVRFGFDVVIFSAIRGLQDVGGATDPVTFVTWTLTGPKNCGGIIITVPTLGTLTVVVEFGVVLYVEFSTTDIVVVFIAVFIVVFVVVVESEVLVVADVAIRGGPPPEPGGPPVPDAVTVTIVVP